MPDLESLATDVPVAPSSQVRATLAPVQEGNVVSVEISESKTPWWWDWDPSVAPYAVLLLLLAQSRISADEFETLFLPLYKSDSTKWPEEIYRVLDQLFYAVDDYNRDPILRDNDVDANQLRSRAALAFAELRKLATK
ncbi:colicin immunity domain-containing protein [Arthrobacter sp. TS-15]|uniref:colicin immunity domain-containing protein n=1 Tax=Arthrobacter sp. TS-15 TaxID=2510797 RepID=UPI001356D346|nr:colicin immunity domain-containing protein [Arthrobacter sp. TS-15]